MSTIYQYQQKYPSPKIIEQKNEHDYGGWIADLGLEKAQICGGVDHLMWPRRQE